MFRTDLVYPSGLCGVKTCWLLRQGLKPDCYVGGRYEEGRKKTGASRSLVESMWDDIR